MGKNTGSNVWLDLAGQVATARHKHTQAQVGLRQAKDALDNTDTEFMAAHRPQGKNDRERKAHEMAERMKHKGLVRAKAGLLVAEQQALRAETTLKNLHSLEAGLRFDVYDRIALALERNAIQIASSAEGYRGGSLGEAAVQGIMQRIVAGALGDDDNAPVTKDMVDSLFGQRDEPSRGGKMPW